MKNRLSIISSMFIFASGAYAQTIEPPPGYRDTKMPPSGYPGAPVEPGSAPTGGGITLPPTSGPGCTRLPLAGDDPIKGGMQHVRYLSRNGAEFQVITSEYDAFVEGASVYVQTKFVKECIKGEWKVINEVVEQATTSTIEPELSVIQVDVKLNDYNRSSGLETLVETIRSKFSYDFIGIDKGTRLETTIRTAVNGKLERVVNDEIMTKTSDIHGVTDAFAKRQERISRTGLDKNDRYLFAYSQKRNLSNYTRDYEGEWDMREVYSRDFGNPTMTNLGIGRIKKDDKSWEKSSYVNDVLIKKETSRNPLNSFADYANERMAFRFMIISSPDTVEAYSGGLCYQCMIPGLPPIE